MTGTMLAKNHEELLQNIAVARGNWLHQATRAMCPTTVFKTFVVMLFKPLSLFNILLLIPFSEDPPPNHTMSTTVMARKLAN
jgi:hypothetical protein